MTTQGVPILYWGGWCTAKAPSGPRAMSAVQRDLVEPPVRLRPIGVVQG